MRRTTPLFPEEAAQHDSHVGRTARLRLSPGRHDGNSRVLPHARLRVVAVDHFGDGFHGNRKALFVLQYHDLALVDVGGDFIGGFCRPASTLVLAQTHDPVFRAVDAREFARRAPLALAGGGHGRFLGSRSAGRGGRILAGLLRGLRERWQRQQGK